MESKDDSIGDRYSSTNSLEIDTEVMNFKLLCIPKEIMNIEDKWPSDMMLMKEIKQVNK